MNVSVLLHISKCDTCKKKGFFVVSLNFPFHFLWCMGNFLHNPTSDVTLGPSFDSGSYTLPLFDGGPMCEGDPWVVKSGVPYLN